MPNLDDQLRRYGGYLDALESPPLRVGPTRASRWSSSRPPVVWHRIRRPRLALVLTSAVALVVTSGIVLVVARDDRPGPVQATREAGAARKATADETTPADAVAPAGAIPDATTRSSVEQQVRGSLGTCPTVGEARTRARQVTTTAFGTAYDVRVDAGAGGTCARLARIDWDRRTVHLERFGSTP